MNTNHIDMKKLQKRFELLKSEQESKKDSVLSKRVEEYKKIKK